MDKDLFEQVSSSKDLWQKLLIGSLLSFVPLLNIFALGYWFRYCDKVRRTQDASLPEWTDWAGLFIDGLKMLGIILLWHTLPIGIGWVLAILISLISFGLLAMPALTLVTVIAVVFVPFTISALIFFQRKGQCWAVLLDWRHIISPVQRTAGQLILPILAYAGFLIVGSPLYGVAIFVGTLIVISYQTILFVQTFQR